MTRNEALEKIQKLLAVARGTDNEAEATAFMEKVHSMLAEFNLTLGSVEQHTADDPSLDDILETASIDKNGNRPWIRQVWFSTAQLYFCTYFFGGHKKSIHHHVVGAQHNCDIVLHMAKYFVDTVDRLATEYDPARTKEYSAFRRGAGMRLATRIHAKRKAAAAPSSSNPGNLPALYESNSRKLQSYLDANHNLGKARQSNYTGDHAAFTAGRAAGATIGLNTQVNNAKQGRLT